MELLSFQLYTLVHLQLVLIILVVYLPINAQKLLVICGTLIISAVYKCSLATGDGEGDSEVKIGDQTGAACVAACIARKEYDQTINGVTVYAKASKPGCWCERGMKKVSGRSIYKTCFMKKAGKCLNKMLLRFVRTLGPLAGLKLNNISNPWK